MGAALGGSDARARILEGETKVRGAAFKQTVMSERATAD
jgi:hypothetical protein